MLPLQPVPPQAPRLHKSRPTPFVVKKPATTNCEFLDSQEWLQERFEGLKPRDFSDEVVAMYTVRELAAPSGFHQVWHPIREHHRASGSVPAEEVKMLSSVQVFLVFADVNDKNQMQDVEHIARFLHSHFEKPQRPRVIFVQHSVRPNLRRATDEDLQFQALADVSRHGVHDSIIGEKVTFKLAWAVQNQLLQHEAVQQQWSDCVLANREMIEATQDVAWNIDGLFWDYLRVRLQTHLPAVDRNIPPGLPLEIDGVQIGPFVGAGIRGEVYGLMKGGVATGHVLKRIPKHQITHVRGIENLRQEIEVMGLVSSKSWAHPHIVKLHEIYHSETHVFFRMGDGGSRDLAKRLRQRDKHHSPLNFLSEHKAKAICSQMLSAICHLHSGPKIAHCDIKPENIILHETTDDIHITVCDLDTAMVKPKIPSYGVIGTYPLMAPEILLHEMFDPYAADVWSMAVAFLEVACCGKVLEQALGLQGLTGQVNRRAMKVHQKKMTVIIHRYFKQEGSTSNLLDAHLRPELQDLKLLLMAVLPGMLNVRIDGRSRSSEVLMAFNAVGEESDIQS